jgi:hypothetical protein
MNRVILKEKLKQINGLGKFLWLCCYILDN